MRDRGDEVAFVTHFSARDGRPLMFHVAEWLDVGRSKTRFSAALLSGCIHYELLIRRIISSHWSDSDPTIDGAQL